MAIETPTAPDVVEIRAAIVARLQALRPLVEECARLERAEAALDRAMAKLDQKRQ